LLVKTRGSLHCDVSSYMRSNEEEEEESAYTLWQATEVARISAPTWLASPPQSTDRKCDICLHGAYYLTYPNGAAAVEACSEFFDSETANTASTLSIQSAC